ncbi:MAG: hypothetical protein RJB39_359 [Candidatus Parcubacteria bacterium]|jgi:hypothetical protein
MTTQSLSSRSRLNLAATLFVAGVMQALSGATPQPTRKTSTAQIGEMHDPKVLFPATTLIGDYYVICMPKPPRPVHIHASYGQRQPMPKAWRAGGNQRRFHRYGGRSPNHGFYARGLGREWS